MEISKLLPDKRTASIHLASKQKPAKDFNQELNSANKRQRDSHLHKLLEEIKKKGKRVIETGSINAVHEYKEHIREYLSIVLKDAYTVQKLRSIYNNPATLVDIINRELDELAQTVLTEEKGTIKIVSKIERIEGLLLDTYK